MSSSTCSRKSPGDPSRRPGLPAPGVPPTAELVLLGAPVVLRDGSPVRIRPGHSSDRQLLVQGFARLSPESRY
ncbi:MAG: hypothetical protein ACXVUX_10045, partial [Solirubrobacteraceae bacterium]